MRVRRPGWSTRSSCVISAYFLTVPVFPARKTRRCSMAARIVFFVAVVAMLSQNAIWTSRAIRARRSRRDQRWSALDRVVLASAAGIDLAGGITVDVGTGALARRVHGRVRCAGSSRRAGCWPRSCSTGATTCRRCSRCSGLRCPRTPIGVSAYLPMNAAIRAVFVLLGAPALEERRPRRRRGSSRCSALRAA